jgi:hypothetical protein
MAERVFLWLHVALLVLGYCLLGIGRFAPLSFAVAILLVWVIRVIAGFGLVTGLALMALRRGKSESITLAVSTVAAFVLLVLVFL